VPLNPDDLLLTGDVCVVTGAAQGIGRATAEALRAFGAVVAGCDRDADGLRELDLPMMAVLDVRDARAVHEFVQTVVDALGRIDVLVNNVGGGFQADFLDVSAKGQAALVAENFESVTSFVRACVPHMRKGGAIVNITSVEAHRAAPGFAVYSAMKAAVENLTKTLALELGHAGIRVTCVAPDVIPTPGIGDLDGVVTPLGGPGHVDDVAAAVVYLVGRGGGFVTGTTVHVDGGTHAAGGWYRAPDGTWLTR
jgi:NAD(P)-dependent dehydrogenase (short-subunit alcohol dehydrogenase family)